MSHCERTIPCNECSDCFFNPLTIIIIDSTKSSLNTYATILRNHAFANDKIYAFTDSTKALGYLMRHRASYRYIHSHLSDRQPAAGGILAALTCRLVLYK